MVFERCCNLVVCALLAAASVGMAAQDAGGGSDDWTVKRWGAEDGLPVNSVNDLFRDEAGYLWLATSDGLVRFDGIEFEIFDSARHPGMISDRILVIEPGADGTVWLTSEHARLMRLADGEITTLDRGAGLPHDQVIALERIGGTLWVGTGAGAARFDGRRFRVVGEWSQPTTAITGDAAGGIWLGSRSGALAHVDGEDLAPLPALDGRIWMLLDDPDRGLWIAHDNGLSLWRDGDYRTPPGPLAAIEQRVLRIEKTRAGDLVLHAGDTLYRFDGERLTALGERRNVSGRERLTLEWPGRGLFRVAGRNRLVHAGETVLRSDSTINPALVDRDDNLWVATSGDGLYQVRANPFETFGGQPALASQPTYPIVAGEQAIWIGTSRNGFATVDPVTARVVPGSHRVRDIDLVYALLPPASPGGRAWIGGIGLFHLQNGDPGQEGVPARLREAEVRGLFRDRDGRVWTGTDFDGLWWLDAGHWQQLALPGGLARARVRVFVQGANDTLWMGTNGAGVIRWQDGAFERIGPEHGLASALVRSLLVDDAGRVWVGTENHGLCRIANPGAAVAALDIACMDIGDGLFDDGIHQILADARGYFWMSSNRGIFRVAAGALNAVLDGAREQVRSTVFTEADGLPNREANGGVHSAGAVGPDGRLWFPTMDGPVVIDPENLPEPVAAAAVIEAIETPQAVHRPGDNILSLPVGERELSLRFTAPGFIKPAHTQFEYRLVGYQENWRSAGYRRQVDFTNLAHGEYRFEARALGSDGTPGAVAGVDLELPPRLAETAGFRLSMVAAALGVLLMAWYLRERSQRQARARLTHEVAVRTRELEAEKAESERSREQLARQAERLTALDEEKRDFFANISHELRTPLTLLLGPLERAGEAPERLLDQVPMMQRNARRLNRLVEQILDLQRIEAGQMGISPDLHDLDRWCADMAGLFRPLARRQGIDFAVEAPVDGLLAWFDDGQMEKVVGNLLSNAIKYCRREDRVRLRVKREGEDAVVEIEDTGPGIAPEHLPHLFDRFYRAEMPGSSIEGTGIGLALARELVRLHGGDVSVESKPGEGSRFGVRWPARAQSGRLPAAAKTPPPAVPASSDLPRADKSAAQRKAGAAGRKRLLLVDDNPDLRAWLQNELRADFRIDEAGDGEQALARMRRSLPDLVISDWMMPELDGVGLIRQMRADPILSGVPVILLSARAEGGDQLDGLGAGAVAYVQKPFRLDLLCAQIDSVFDLLLRLRERRREETAGPSAERDEAVSARQKRLDNIVAGHFHDPEFGVQQFADALAVSRASLFRKVKDETGCSPSEFLRRARLSRARSLLKDRLGSVSEVAYAVGFNSLDGFAKAYRRRYGHPPSTTPDAGDMRADRPDDDGDDQTRQE